MKITLQEIRDVQDCYRGYNDEQLKTAREFWYSRLGTDPKDRTARIHYTAVCVLIIRYEMNQ